MEGWTGHLRIIFHRMEGSMVLMSGFRFRTSRLGWTSPRLLDDQMGIDESQQCVINSTHLTRISTLLGLEPVQRGDCSWWQVWPRMIQVWCRERALWLLTPRMRMIGLKHRLEHFNEFEITSRIWTNQIILARLIVNSFWRRLTEISNVSPTLFRMLSQTGKTTLLLITKCQSLSKSLKIHQFMSKYQLSKSSHPARSTSNISLREIWNCIWAKALRCLHRRIARKLLEKLNESLSLQITEIRFSQTISSTWLSIPTKV